MAVFFLLMLHDTCCVISILNIFQYCEISAFLCSVYIYNTCQLLKKISIKNSGCGSFNK